MANTCAKAVAIYLTDEPCLAVYQLYSALCTGNNAQTAAITFVFIYFYDISQGQGQLSLT
jgi:hypothetical protein